MSADRNGQQWIVRWSFALTIALGAIGFLISYHYHSSYLENTLRWSGDPLGYYQYLPACIGTHSWDQLPQATLLENGRRLDVYTMGVAVLQAPFFALGWCMARISGAVTDGYSAPFAVANLLATVVYVCIGCNLLFHALRRRFSIAASVLAVLLLCTATNLYCYTLRESGMSHPYSFFLFCALFHLVVRMRDEPTAWRWFWMMVVGALIILVRPINGIALLFPLLYLVDEKNRLSERLRWPRRFPLATACGSVAALLLWLPQLLYWRSITGELFIFSYGRKGEHFEWSHPHLLDILLNVRNGWFIYTPIMLPVIIALMCMAWKRIEGARTILIIWSLAWMTYACWWSWWLGGAFGFRGFIEYYAFLAVPLAWIVQRVLEQRWPTRLSALLICAALVIINIRMTVMFDWAWSSSEWTWTDLRGTWARIF